MEEQIEKWKEEFGEVYVLPVEDKTAYLRMPNMTDFKRAFVAMQKEGELAFGEVMLNALFIGGDEDIKTNDDYFLPARKELVLFFNFEDAEIETKGNKAVIKIEHDDGETAQCTIRTITRDDLKIAEKRNPSGKPFVTQEALFGMVVLEKDKAFDDKNNAKIRFPLYSAIEKLQNKKVASLKKL